MDSDSSARSPSPPSRARGPRVRVIHLTGPVLAALAAGDLATANALSPVPLTDSFVAPDCLGTWRRRADQVEQDPGSAAWVTGVIWDEEREVAVGRAGFHAPPDGSGTVEIGYAVVPAFRRRGYARAALESLLRRAVDDETVRSVRVSIRPDNVASSTLVAGYGFTIVGEQWDDEDGLEVVSELDVSHSP